jgi:hypothetical protein
MLRAATFTLSLVLLFFQQTGGRGVPGASSGGGSCDTITNCPATDRANTFTATQTFPANTSGWFIGATGSSISAEADDYGASTLTFGSYYRSDWLVANGHAENTPFLAYIEAVYAAPVTDAAIGDVVANTAAGATFRVGFCAATPCASAVQISAAGANFNAIPVKTTNLTLGGAPITQAATQPTGACTALGWVLSNDGHITFCNGTTYVSKV